MKESGIRGCYVSRYLPLCQTTFIVPDRQYCIIPGPKSGFSCTAHDALLDEMHAVVLSGLD